MGVTSVTVVLERLGMESPGADIPTVAAPDPAPDCPDRGGVVDSGADCGCGPTHLCNRHTRVVGADDCAACVARDLADTAPVYRRFGRRERFTVPAGCGVLAACDTNQFVPLQLLLCSLLLSHDCPVAVVDLGLEPAEREWVASQGVAVLPPPPHPFAPDVHYWQSWVKPYLIRSSPFRRTLWLDCDTLVDGDLNPVFDAVGAGPLLIDDAFTPDRGVMANRPELYGRFPVATVCGGLNAGVLGFEPARDAAVLDCWTGMLDLAASDPGLRDLIAWYDQGALIWAAGKLGLPVSGRVDWNRPGRSPAALHLRFPTPGRLLDSLPAGTGSAVWHFPGSPKPYGWSAPLAVEPGPDPGPGFKVFVLGHDPAALAAVPARPFLEPYDLNRTGLPNFFAESRFFLSLSDADVDAMPDWVGFATQSWDRKYAGRALPLAELHRLPRLDPGTVYAADIHYMGRDWADIQDAVCPGMRPYIDTIRSWNPPENRQSFWSNNFVCHKTVFRQFLAHFRAVRARMLAEWGDVFGYRAVDPTRQGGYLYESVGVNYWGARDDLQFLPCMPGPGGRTGWEPLPTVEDGPLGGCVAVTGRSPHGDPNAWTPRLWDALIGPGSRVLDLGCGLGHAARYFRDALGCDVVAVDGSRKVAVSAVVPVAVHDLTAGPYRADPPADAVWCCELVEHVDPWKADHVADSLAQSPLVLMTHGLPGQPGHHHVNCQHPDYWVSKMRDRGYALDAAATDLARSLAAADTPHAHFARSGMAFRPF